MNESVLVELFPRSCKLAARVVSFMEETRLFLGLDVGKSEIIVTLMDDGEKELYRGPFKNQLSGFRKMMKAVEKEALKISGEHHIHAGMEATGTYYLKLVKYLYEKEERVTPYVINPNQVKKYMEYRGSRTKTDLQDSRVIAMCVRDGMEKKIFRPWFPSLKEHEELKQLVRLREDLLTMKTMETNRIEGLRQNPDSSAQAMRILEDHVTYLSEQIKEIEKILKDNIKHGNFPDTGEDIERLKSIPGISDLTATSFISEIGDVTRFEGIKQIVAHAGLAPMERQSGTSVRGKTRICKRGSKKLRQLLYMPTLSAIRCNPVIKEFYQRLLAKGKRKMVAVTACMRKMLHIMYGILKNKTCFDPAICMGKVN